MIALAAPPEDELPVDFEPLDVESHTDEELDRLPFGVIALAHDGTVLRYNLAEARFSRLDRTQVLGRSFFRTVEPCTATAAFEGRFRAFLQDRQRSTTFEYLLDFKFGAQLVEVELIRSERQPVIYVLLHRLRFFPARSGLPQGYATPLQSELAGDEPELGVLRDASARRVVLASPMLFSGLRAAWDRVAPRGWAIFSAEWGFQWGRLAVVDLEAEVLELHGEGLRELPMQTVGEVLAGYLRRHGLGALSVEIGNPRSGAFALRVQRSALAEAVGRSEVPRCQLLAGFFRAVFNHLAHKLLVVREVACLSQGRGECTFVVASQKRTQALEQACERSGGRIEQVLAALAEPEIR